MPLGSALTANYSWGFLIHYLWMRFKTEINALIFRGKALKKCSFIAFYQIDLGGIKLYLKLCCDKKEKQAWMKKFYMGDHVNFLSDDAS